jgi:hypothetical protein
MNRTLNLAGLIVPLLSLAAVVIQQQMQIVKDPTTVAVLGGVLVLINYVIHPTQPVDQTPTNPPSSGKPLVMIIGAMLIFGLARPAHAQYGAAAFVQRKQTYAVGIGQVYNHIQHGKLSLDLKALLGANVTDPSAAFGVGEIASYDLGKGWSGFAGIGIAVPFRQFRVDTIQANKLGLVIGFSGPVDLSFLGLK